VAAFVPKHAAISPPASPAHAPGSLFVPRHDSVDPAELGITRRAPVGSEYGMDATGRRYAVPPTSTNANPREMPPAYYLEPVKRTPDTIGAPTDPNPKEYPLREFTEYRPGPVVGRLDAFAYENVPFYREAVRSRVAANYRQQHLAEPDPAYVDNVTRQILEQEGNDYPAEKLLGMAAPMLIPMSRAAGVPGALRRALPMAGYAGLMGAGRSEDPTLEGKLRAGLGAAGSTALLSLGTEAALAARKAPRAVADAATRAFLTGKAGIIGAQNPLALEGGRAAEKLGAVGMGMSAAESDRILDAARQRVGEKVGNAVSAMEAAGFQGSAPRELALATERTAPPLSAAHDPRPGIVSSEVEALYPMQAERAAQERIDAWPTSIQQAQQQAEKIVAELDAKLAAQGVQPAVRQAAIARQMQQFSPIIEPPPALPKFAPPKRVPLTPEGNVPLRDQVNLVRSHQRLAEGAYRDVQPAATAEQFRAISGALNAETERALAAQQPFRNTGGKDLVGDFLAAKKEAGPVLEASKFVEEAAARQANRNPLGMLEAAAATAAGAATGSPAAALKSGILAHLARTRGMSSLSRSARFIDELLGVAETPLRVLPPGVKDIARYQGVPAAAMRYGVEQGNPDDDRPVSDAVGAAGAAAAKTPAAVLRFLSLFLPRGTRPPALPPPEP
jgi:hypothetical protein